MPNAEDELVLLIHGTFAAPEEGKLKWWEIDSDPWKAIRKQLPKGTRLANRKEIFFWSGENQERDRYQAGVRLLHRLLKLEKQGRPYHLIGHSHGGSVIWHALQEAVRRRIGRKRPDSRLQLSNLRSWATIGTPFLQFNESRMGRWPGAIATKFFFLVSWGLTIFLLVLLFKNQEAVDDVLESLLRLLGIAADAATAEWLSYAAFGILFSVAAILGMALHMWVSAIRQEALSVRQTALVRNQAMLEFGDRWLGLWSREDEAIGGLKGSIRLRVQLLPKLQFVPTRVFLYDKRIWTYRFLLRWILAPIVNRFIPYGNTMILSTVSKTAQGNDRPGCNVTSVSEGPICLQGTFQYPTLPDDIDGELTRAANDRLIEKAPDFVPKVRTLLADYSSGVAMLGGGVKAAGFEFVGDELIHTSYFGHPGVLSLLSHHIQVHCPEHTSTQRGDDSLGKWYQTVRQEVKNNVTKNPQVEKRSLTFLGKQNRLAVLAVTGGLVALCTMVVAGMSSSNVEILRIISGIAALLALIAGRIGQLRAERGARFRRFANLGVNLGLLWLALLVLL